MPYNEHQHPGDDLNGNCVICGAMMKKIPPSVHPAHRTKKPAHAIKRRALGLKPNTMKSRNPWVR